MSVSIAGFGSGDISGPLSDLTSIAEVHSLAKATTSSSSAGKPPPPPPPPQHSTRATASAVASSSFSFVPSTSTSSAALVAPVKATVASELSPFVAASTPTISLGVSADSFVPSISGSLSPASAAAFFPSSSSSTSTAAAAASKAIVSASSTVGKFFCGSFILFRRQCGVIYRSFYFVETYCLPSLLLAFFFLAAASAAAASFLSDSFVDDAVTRRRSISPSSSAVNESFTAVSAATSTGGSCI